MIKEFQLAMPVPSAAISILTLIVTVSPAAIELADEAAENLNAPVANACTDAIDAIIAVAAANAAILFVIIIFSPF